MTRVWFATVICGLVVTVGLCAAGVAVAAGNEAPLANAGLDQEVPENATVWLDATGSVDPDGEIQAYEWTIETPAGATLYPACRRCGETEFRADTVGTYEVTVAVTDDDGATRRDTLYVRVEPVENPDVELAAPETVTEGESVNITATADAGEAELAELDVAVNGSELASRSLAGESAAETVTTTLNESGEHVVGATVVDRLGRTATVSTSVTVEARDDESNGGSADEESGDAGESSSSSSGSGSDDSYSCDDPNLPDWYVGCEDKVYGGGSDGDLILLDADGDGEVNVDSGYPNSEVTFETDTGLRLDSTDTVDAGTYRDTNKKAFRSDNKNSTTDLSEKEEGFSPL